MNKRVRARLAAAAVAALAAIIIGLGQELGWFAAPAQILDQAQPGLYEVVRFSDGDTIVVDMNGTEETVRMIGVDTPETHAPGKPVQCYGPEASDFTKNLIGAQKVRLEADPTNQNRDRYNRLLRYIYLPDNTLVQAEIIRQGYGFSYTQFPFTKSAEFESLEDQAETAKLGLWDKCTVKIEANGREQTSPQ